MTWVGPAVLFVLGALAGLGAFAWRGWVVRMRFALIAVAAIWLALGREPFVVFLLVFLVPTAVALADRRARWSVSAAGFAAGDLLLAMGMSAHHAATGSWALPAPGELGAGTLPVAAAALTRVAASALERREGDRGVLIVGWWQGLLLAWWVGDSASTLLALGGLAMWGAARALLGRGAAGMLLGGGLALALAGFGAPAPAVVAAGIAGMALSCGEQAASSWVLAALPLSGAALVLGGSEPHPVALGAAAIGVPVAWALAIGSVTDPPASRGGTTLGIASVVGMLAAFATRFWPWMLLAALLFAAGRFAIAHEGPPPPPEESLPADRHPVAEAAAWTGFVLAAALTLRLALIGAGTGFL